MGPAGQLLEASVAGLPRQPYSESQVVAGPGVRPEHPLLLHARVR